MAAYVIHLLDIVCAWDLCSLGPSSSVRAVFASVWSTKLAWDVFFYLFTLCSHRVPCACSIRWWIVEMVGRAQLDVGWGTLARGIQQGLPTRFEGCGYEVLPTENVFFFFLSTLWHYNLRHYYNTTVMRGLIVCCPLPHCLLDSLCCAYNNKTSSSVVQPQLKGDLSL